MIRRAIPFALVCAMTPTVHALETWSLKTGDTALTVTVNAGQLAVTSLSSAGRAPDWIGTPVPVSLPDHVFLNHTSQFVRWKFMGNTGSHTGGGTTLRFISSEPKLELLSIWQAQSGPGPVEHHFEIVNRSGQMIEMPLQPSLVLGLSAPAGHSLENWWVEKGGGRPSEIGTHCEPIGAGYRFKGQSTPYAATPEMIPWISIQDLTGSGGVYFGIEFSGRVGIDVSAAGQPLR